MPHLATTPPDQPTLDRPPSRTQLAYPRPRPRRAPDQPTLYHTSRGSLASHQNFRPSQAAYPRPRPSPRQPPSPTSPTLHLSPRWFNPVPIQPTLYTPALGQAQRQASAHLPSRPTTEILSPDGGHLCAADRPTRVTASQPTYPIPHPGQKKTKSHSSTPTLQHSTPRVLPVRLASCVAGGLSLGNLGEEGLTLSRS